MVGLLFASGATALVYQVLWQRQFALLLGSATPATTAVLAAFFAGLGLGSLALGRLATRCARPLRAYAILEILIGLGALAVAPILTGFESFYPWLFERLSDHPGAFLAAKTGLAFTALALPTVAMGGTLPVLAQWLDRGPRRLGLSAGALYAANTLGAAAGALAVPFLLLPSLGITATLVTCACLNGLVAATAWVLDRRELAPEPAPASAPTPTPTPGLSSRGAPPRSASTRELAGFQFPHRTLLALSATSGALTLALQVLWNRAFSQIHENSMHAFAVIAAVFILALAAGAQLARFGLRRGLPPLGLFGLSWTLGGALVLLTPWLFVSWTRDLTYLPTVAEGARQGSALVTLVLGVLFAPVTLLGVAFPALLEAAGEDRSRPAGPLLGRLLAINVAGCVVGALAGGFLLPQTCGLWTGIAILGGCALIAGFTQLGALTPRYARPLPWPRRFAPFALGLLFLLLTLPASSRLPRLRLATAQGEKLIAVSEGNHGIVAVTERPGSRRLKLNNHYSLGGTLAVGDQRAQTHLPLLVHPAPRRIAMLGLGTGISAGGAMFHPHDALDVVELVPEVITASRAHFADVTAGMFDSPQTRVVPEDARNYLRGTSRRYDVILGDLVVPWRQGEGSLFTREQFVAARQALAPGGLFCQWIPMFQVSETEFQILLRTFLDVFPAAFVWRGDFSPDRPALALMGSVDGHPPDPTVVRQRLAAMKADATNPHLVEPAGVWMHFVGRVEAADLDPRERRLNTEDRPWIELLGPRIHAGERTSALFIGRPLQRWLEGIRARTESGLPGLQASEWTAVRSGEKLFRFSQLLRERNEREALALRDELTRELPAVVARGIFGPAAAP